MTLITPANSDFAHECRQIFDYFASEDFAADQRRRNRYLDELFEQYIWRSGVKPGTVLVNKDADEFFNGYIQVAVADTAKQVKGYSPFRWLWYTRRFPLHVYGKADPKVVQPTMQFIDSLSGLSQLTAEELPTQLEGVPLYRLDSCTFRRCADLLVSAFRIETLKGYSLSIRKGAELRVLSTSRMKV